MAQTNYLNPTSFLPNVAQAFPDGGPMAGIQYHNQMNDYNRIMGIQHFLQQLGAQREGQEHTEFMAGAPLRALKGQRESEQLQGELPFVKQLASETAQTAIGSQRFTRETAQSTEAKTEFFRGLRQKATDDQWKQYQTELNAGANLANTALQIAENEGETKAQAYVQHQIQQLQSRGIELPQDFTDPKRWKGLRDSAVQSVGHMQTMEKTGAEVAGRQSVAETQARATVAAAGARQGAEPKLSPDQLLGQLQTKVFNGSASPEEVQQYGAQVHRKWGDNINKNPILQSLQMQAQRGGEKGINAQVQLDNARNEFMRQWGVKVKDAEPTPQPAKAKKSGPVKFGDMPKAK